uniref:E3 ubiquitin-protein ligase RBBP6 n=1 Tax=Panagrolaimus sp. PS1159 TaxID=55785 RepID=A0AC35G6C0_9BILA
MASTSSIHYKFGNDVELKRLAFEGIHISLDELKKSVSQIEGINMDFVDLSLSNADTKREYEGACFIPRNSTVILKRVPRPTPIRMPKMNAPETSGANHGFQHGTVPPDFRCHRCGNLGHHPKQCLMQNVRKTTGIPSEELMDASPTDPNALLHQSGRYVIPILHYKARETRKLVDRALIEREKQLANNKITLNTNNSKYPVPQELECPLCHELLEDALLAPCCGESFCADCIQNYMLKCSQTDEGITQCPTCPGSKPLSIDKLIPNKRIRDTVKKHKSFIAAANKTNTSGAIPLAAVPVAAHELSTNSHSLNASPMNVISSSQHLSQIIQLPTVNLTNVGSPTILPAKPIIVADLTKPPPILNSPATASPTPDICKADLPPGINPTSLYFNPNIPPPNISLQLPPTNFYHPMAPTMEYYGMINGSMNSPSTWQHSNDVPPGLCKASRSSSDMPPGTELNSCRPPQNKDDIYERSEYFGDITLDEISKINKSWDSVRSDEEPIQKRLERHRESRDTRIERRSRSPRDRTSRHDRDRRERDKERDDDERRYRTSRVYDERNGRRNNEEKSARKEKDEKGVRRENNEKSIRKNKEEDGHKDERVNRRHEKSSRKDGHEEERTKKREDGHDETSHQKDKESSKHKKKSSKKEKKKKRDHSS